MKKFSFLAMAAMGMLFAACSSDKDVALEQSNGDLLNGRSEGYFKINLNLPTQPVASTRAPWEESASGTLSDGLAKEYAVGSVLLLVFEGASENVATLKQVITPTTDFTSTDSDNPNQITTNKEFVAKLDNAPTSNLYALAVINGSGIIEAGSDNTKVKINGGGDVAGIKLSDLQVATSNAMITSDKFFMTNAVLSKAKGGVADPTASPELQILSPIKSEYIYETESAATAGTAATDIYVERGVAKVTVDNTSLATSAVKTKDGATATVSFEGWVLDNTEDETYIVRKVPTSFTWNLTTNASSVTIDKYRFVGGNAVDANYGTSHFFRTYWAEDPQYTTEAAGKTTTTTPTFPTKTAVGNDYPQYCHENTFPVAQQTHKNTTRAIVKVNLSASDFYTIGADRKTMYTLDNVKDIVKTDLMDQSAFATWWGANSSTALTGAGIKEITFSSTDAGVITVTDITINRDAFTPNKSDDISVNTDVTGGADMITQLNTMLAKVEYFKGGVSYYVIRVKHFGDDLTPWNNGEFSTKPANGSVDDIYPNDARRDANYLGRYGMVRNNWYDIKLGEILKIGSSTVPSVPGDDTPDDELEDQYIKARINILSWAKRTQNWNLK
jgi:hypothetical protein